MQQNPKTNAKFWSALGLCMRAGKCVTGEDSVLKTIRNNQAKAVIIAADASANTTKKFMDKCRFYNVPCMRWGSRKEIGRSIGKSERVVLAITDTGFAEMIQKHSENLSEVKDIE